MHPGSDDHNESGVDAQIHRNWDTSRYHNTAIQDEEVDGIPSLISDIDFFLDADDLSWLNSGPIDL